MGKTDETQMPRGFTAKLDLLIVVGLIKIKDFLTKIAIRKHPILPSKTDYNWRRRPMFWDKPSRSHSTTGFEPCFWADLKTLSTIDDKFASFLKKGSCYNGILVVKYGGFRPD